MTENELLEFSARLDVLSARLEQRAAQVLELWQKISEDMREIKTAREILSNELLKNNLPG